MPEFPEDGRTQLSASAPQALHVGFRDLAAGSNRKTLNGSSLSAVEEEAILRDSNVWIRSSLVQRTKYSDPTGRTRLWEQVERTTRQRDTDVDAVGIVALLQDKSRTKEHGGAGDEQGHALSPPITAPAPLPYPFQEPQHPQKKPLSNTNHFPYHTGTLILLEKQFRPALGAPCIEIPAGLIDPGEDVETTAIRELREETGYVGEVMKPAHPALMGRAGEPTTSWGGGGKDEGEGERSKGWKWGPVLYNDPGITQTSTLILYLSVDLSNPANQNPTPQLEEGEFIQTFTVPLKNLYAECRRLEEEEGCLIDARVGTLAEGIELSRGLGL
ncbi:MAG: hypothetical protein M1831_002152 [Alyxoria varia]|nr:MAG: hypothetical protein M1831_002152 [Alyxoria varia]